MNMLTLDAAQAEISYRQDRIRHDFAAHPAYRRRWFGRRNRPSVTAGLELVTPRTTSGHGKPRVA